MVQNVVVALLVAGCCVYVLWTLGPKAPRKRLAAALLKLPLPLLLQKPLKAATQQQGACGSCGGCERSAGAQGKPGPLSAGQPVQPGYQPIAFVRGASSKKLQY